MYRCISLKYIIKLKGYWCTNLNALVCNLLLFLNVCPLPAAVLPSSYGGYNQDGIAHSGNNPSLISNESQKQLSHSKCRDLLVFRRNPFLRATRGKTSSEQDYTVQCLRNSPPRCHDITDHWRWLPPTPEGLADTSS